MQLFQLQTEIELFQTKQRLNRDQFCNQIVDENFIWHWKQSSDSFLKKNV